MTIPDGVLLAPGCTIADNPQTAQFLQTCAEVAFELGHPITIVHGTDGQHSGFLDPHPFGFAFDVRTHDQINPDLLRTTLLTRLGTDWSDLIEDAGIPNEHLHAQIRKALWQALAPADQIADARSRDEANGRIVA